MELVLLWYKMQHCVGPVIQSLSYPTTKQLPNYCSYLFSRMPMLNSQTFQSSNGLNTITRPTSRRSGGDYPSGQQVAMYWIILQFDWRLIQHSLDPWYGVHRSPFNPGVQDLGNGRLLVGASPLQPWRVGEAPRTRAKQSSSEVLVEDHVRKLDLSHLCFSFKLLFFLCSLKFPLIIPLLTYSQSFFSLSADHPRHSRQRRSKSLVLPIQEKV